MPRSSPLAALWLSLAVLVAPTASAAQLFPWRGVVEGFYGEPWAFSARESMVEFIGQQGMNLYIYAPKDDPLQRELWALPYDAATLERFGALALTGAAHDVAVAYSISPGSPLGRGTPEDSICYSCEEDRALLVAKLRSVVETGFSGVMLSFDDVQSKLIHGEDLLAYGGDLAAAQADLTGAVMAELWLSWPQLSVFFVPTEYKGTQGSPYLSSLGERLIPEAEILWTGPQVLSPQITAADAAAFALAIGRPPLIWDNYPVNDTTMQAELHLGPLRGRSPDLFTTTRGLVANPMAQAEASKIAVATVAAYLNDPARYDPDVALHRALAALGGDAAAHLTAFALQCQHSPLDGDDSAALASAVGAFFAGYGRPGWPTALAPLAAELERQQLASDELPAALDWPGFIDEAAPWLARFDANLAAAEAAVILLMEQRPQLSAEALPIAGGVRISGVARGCDRQAIDEARGRVDRLWGQARRIPAQVHGAQLSVYYMPPPAALSIAGNVVQDLVEGAQRRDKRWQRASDGCEAVTVTVNGAPVPVGSDGAFSTVVPDVGDDVNVQATDGAGFQTRIILEGASAQPRRRALP